MLKIFGLNNRVYYIERIGLYAKHIVFKALTPYTAFYSIAAASLLGYYGANGKIDADVDPAVYPDKNEGNGFSYDGLTSTGSSLWIEDYYQINGDINGDMDAQGYTTAALGIDQLMQANNYGDFEALYVDLLSETSTTQVVNHYKEMYKHRPEGTTPFTEGESSEEAFLLHVKNGCAPYSSKYIKLAQFSTDDQEDRTIYLYKPFEATTDDTQNVFRNRFK